MKLCPVAIAVGCRKCPIYSACPAKGIIGDYRKDDDDVPKAAPGKAEGAGPKRKGR